MSQNLVKILTKCLVDTLVAMEFSDETNINQDFIVEIFEQISAEFQNLSENDKKVLINEIESLSWQYPEKIGEFIKDIPEQFGMFIS